jgi:hypothetical protein
VHAAGYGLPALRGAAAYRGEIPMRLLSPVALIAAATFVVSLLATGAEAQPRRRDTGSGYGYVTAESRYTSATITGPVRYGPHGRLEVRLPGGTWLECGRSCSDTLRRETIDFWYSRDPRGSTDGPGYLKFRF